MRWPALLLLAALHAPGVRAEVALESLITDERLGEISGLAASRQHEGVFWVHNDGGNPAELYAIDQHGELRATLRLDGARNIDWEDIAAFELDGRHYLAVADVGDNGGLRRELLILVIEEPAELRDLRRAPAWTQRFRWPDGARDCEALAIDAGERTVYLVSKKRVPPELFRLPLGPGDGSARVAERIATLAGIEQPTRADLERNPVYGRYRAQITAADISPDGRHFAVLNYRRVYLWTRGDGDWSDAVRGRPRIVEFPWVPQAEALGFEKGSDALWISSERLPAPLIRLRPRVISR